MTVQIDYTFDSNHFFDTQAKRDLLQSAADAVAARLTDTLTAITPGGGNTWQESFYNPSTGAVQNVPDPTVPANTIVVYAGGSSLAPNVLGEGGGGGYSAASGSQAFITAVTTRGQGNTQGPTANDYGPWGGTVSFSTNPATSWNFTTGLPSAGQYDFLSVAEHEIAHVLGFGGSDSWKRLVSGSVFVGTHAVAANGGANVPLSTPDLAHWASGTMSDSHLATMNPSIAAGVREAFTTLDFAGLQDIGWNVPLAGDVNNDHVVNGLDISVISAHWLLPGPQGDANYDGVVNGLDIALISANWLHSDGGGTGTSAVPEPSTIVLVLAAAGLIVVCRRHRLH